MEAAAVRCLARGHPDLPAARTKRLCPIRRQHDGRLQPSSRRLQRRSGISRPIGVRQRRLVRDRSLFSRVINGPPWHSAAGCFAVRRRCRLHFRSLGRSAGSEGPGALPCDLHVGNRRVDAVGLCPCRSSHVRTERVQRSAGGLSIVRRFGGAQQVLFVSARCIPRDRRHVSVAAVPFRSLIRRRAEQRKGCRIARDLRRRDEDRRFCVERLDLGTRRGPFRRAQRAGHAG